MFFRCSIARANSSDEPPGLRQLRELCEPRPPLALDADLPPLEEPDLADVEDPRDVLPDRERGAFLDRRRHDDLHAQDLPERQQAARDDRMLRPEPVHRLAGEVVAELPDLPGRKVMPGADHVLGVGALCPHRAVRVDDDLVDVLGDEQLPELAQVVLGMAAGRGQGRGLAHQNITSLLTKMVSRSPWSMLIVGAIRR